MLNDGNFDPSKLLNTGAALCIQNHAKQRYFNLSRYIMDLRRLVDAKRDFDMDSNTWTQAMTQMGALNQEFKQPVVQQPQPDIKNLIIDAIREVIKPEALKQL
jgi:hypothetical protein